MKLVKCPNSVPKYNICPICHNAFNDIMSSQTCGHSFCKTCTDCLDTCPVCGVPQGGFIPNRTFRNIINEHNDRDLPLPGACSWSGKIEELAEHRNQCDYQEIKCEQYGCTHKCFRKDMKNHITFDHNTQRWILHHTSYSLSSRRGDRKRKRLSNRFTQRSALGGGKEMEEVIAHLETKQITG